MALMPASLSVIGDEVIHLSVAESGLLSGFTCLFSVVSVAVSMSLCPPVSLQTLLCKHP